MKQTATVLYIAVFFFVFFPPGVERGESVVKFVFYLAPNEEEWM